MVLKQVSYTELFRTFLKIGLFSFGGTIHLLRSIESEVVEKKQWIDASAFDRLTKSSQLLPGMASVSVALKCGFLLRGLPGFFIAGLCFILPGSLFLTFIGVYYKELGGLEIIQPFLYGLKPAVLAILLFSVIKYGFKNITSLSYLPNFIFVIGAYFTGFDIILILLFTTAANILFSMGVSKGKVSKSLVAPVAGTQLTPVIQLSALSIFSIFIKIGIFLAGSGFVIVAFANEYLVQKGFLDLHSLLDSVALSLFVPGPMTGLATFLGYQLSGWIGAVAATSGLLLPTIIFSLITLFMEPVILSNRFFQYFSASLKVALLGFLAASTISMSYTSLQDYKLWIIAIICLIILLKWPRMNKIWLLIISANLGYIIYHYLF